MGVKVGCKGLLDVSDGVGHDLVAGRLADTGRRGGRVTFQAWGLLFHQLLHVLGDAFVFFSLVLGLASKTLSFGGMFIGTNGIDDPNDGCDGDGHRYV